ncbi:GtrA family protein [Massilia sp. Dwa41.01b]|uniref:GtrA family protein n=1 Tax=unclassified Massilia TaxID=2609279 RepID=UPI0016020C56|nr:MULTISPECIES: GtrA family protein [unclassified Massilia]QNA91163.1 GtrA family protein [Massilia sp. Dwa41.01b]QNB01555.1 GtrA family protein [Massilia sp. Se16.2.3]
MTPAARGPDWQRWLRFLCGGAANTLFTYLLYLGLIQLLPYQAAYLAAYVVGIVLAYWLNARFVFKVPLSWRGLFAYPVVYLVQYVVAAGLLEVLVKLGGVPPAYAPLVVTAVLLPLTYLMNKVVLRRSARPAVPVPASKHENQ